MTGRQSGRTGRPRWARPSPRRLVPVVLAALSVLPVPQVYGSPTPRRCAPTAGAVTRLKGHVDSVIALRPPGEVAALISRDTSTSDARFLPHDDLLLIASGGRRRVIVPLPDYTTPPGLAAGADGRTLYVVVDTALLRVDPATGRVEARFRLDLQALGWPAAVVIDGHGRLYVAGQRWTTGLPSAMVEALSIGHTGPPRVLWTQLLGVTHAGIWLTTDGQERLAVYVPDAHDAGGTVEILNHRSGASNTMLASYAADGPPAAADPAHDRLIIEGAGSIRALSLRRGTLSATTPGSSPLALDPARGLAAFVLGVRLEIASERTLRPVASVALNGLAGGPRALAATPDGSSLWVGLPGGLMRLDLRGCSSH